MVVPEGNEVRDLHAERSRILRKASGLPMAQTTRARSPRRLSRRGRFAPERGPAKRPVCRRTRAARGNRPRRYDSRTARVLPSTRFDRVIPRVSPVEDAERLPEETRGRTRPPRGESASMRTMSRSLASFTCWNPSSRTRTSAPRAIASRAPARRSEHRYWGTSGGSARGPASRRSCRSPPARDTLSSAPAASPSRGGARSSRRRGLPRSRRT